MQTVARTLLSNGNRTRIARDAKLSEVCVQNSSAPRAFLAGGASSSSSSSSPSSSAAAPLASSASSLSSSASAASSSARLAAAAAADFRVRGRERLGWVGKAGGHTGAVSALEEPHQLKCSLSAASAPHSTARCSHASHARRCCASRMRKRQHSWLQLHTLTAAPAPPSVALPPACRRRSGPAGHRRSTAAASMGRQAHVMRDRAGLCAQMAAPSSRRCSRGE